MTNEERQLINECRIIIVGEGDFISYVEKELELIGFKEICNVAEIGTSKFSHDNGIIIEYLEEKTKFSAEVMDIPIIFAFDFIEGAGAIVVFSEDEKDFLNKPDIRVWAAEYLLGYCAFWNVEDSDWLHDNLPSIKDGKTSMEAQKTAAHICARIAANIAVSRDVKRYPRFYLCRNSCLDPSQKSYR